MQILRQIGMAVIGLGAVAVWFVMAPPLRELGSVAQLSTRDYADLVTTALGDAETNETLADSAPQQQVVNGWVARDLLAIIASENVDLLEALGAVGDQTRGVASAVAVRDDRVPAMLGLAVLAICWGGITAPRFSPVVSEGPGKHATAT